MDGHWCGRNCADRHFLLQGVSRVLATVLHPHLNRLHYRVEARLALLSLHKQIAFTVLDNELIVLSPEIDVVKHQARISIRACYR